jgi:hypothetical protein
MLQVYVLNASTILKLMLQMFYLDIAYVDVAIYMLQVYVINLSPVLDHVTSVLSGCCICFKHTDFFGTSILLCI